MLRWIFHYILCIVHSLKARVFGEEKIETIFFFIDMIIPGVLSVSAMTTTDYESRPNLERCFAGIEENFEQSNASLSMVDKFIFCDVSKFKDRYWIDSYVVRTLCVSRGIINILTAFNVLEGFFYHKIFNLMKR